MMTAGPFGQCWHGVESQSVGVLVPCHLSPMTLDLLGQSLVDLEVLPEFQVRWMMQAGY
jgi:hypothetical protein